MAALTRREFLRRSAVVAATAALGQFMPLVAHAASARIVVVGAGLAGLTAAYRLSRAGFSVTVLEARGAVGGRTMTVREGVGVGRWVEAGGEGVGSRERAIRALCAELGIGLVDTWRRYPDGRTRYWFADGARSYAALQRDVGRAELHAVEQYGELNWPIDVTRPTARARYWDSVSAGEWIDRHCPGGLAGAAGRYLRVLFEDDFGGPVREASAITLIEDLGGNGGAGSDERWVVAGGSDTIAQRLAAALPGGSVRLLRQLVRVERLLDGRYRAEATGPLGKETHDADRLVLALPFAALAAVDLSAAGLPALKSQAIAGLGMGGNAKMHLAFADSPWEPAYSGETWTDGRLGTTWPGALAQRQTARILVSLRGPTVGQFPDEPVHGPLPAATVAQALDELETVLPGARSAAISSRNRIDVWSRDPFAGGSYAFYRTGSFTSFAGSEGQAVGRLHFGGEHTAPYYRRGTMNGAVISGERVAREMIAAER